MKFPFFRTPKPEPKPTTAVFVPPRAAASKPAPAPASAPPAPMPATSGPTIPVRLNSILAQLPRDLFASTDRSQLAEITLAIPSRMILPQLSSGKVTVTLAELAPCLPDNLLNRGVLISAGQQPILLPLPEMIAALPPESFAVKHESEISLDEPEVASLPALFDEESVRRAASARKAVVPSSTAGAASAPAVPRPVPPPSPTPVVSAPQPVMPQAPRPAPAPPVAPTPEPPTPAKLELPSHITVPETVHVSLRSLVNNMPEKLFVCPKADLWEKTDLDLTVPLPTEPILHQLTSARVTVPVKSVLPLIPSAILVEPLPNIDSEMMAVPLFEIIPQLPPELFTAQLSSTMPQDHVALDAAIPPPFQERAKPVPAAPAQPVAPEFSIQQLEEEAPIFSEKRPSRPLAETTRIQLPAGLAGRGKPAPAPERIAPPAPSVEPPPTAAPSVSQPSQPVVPTPEPAKPVAPTAPTPVAPEPEPAAPVAKPEPEPVAPVAEPEPVMPVAEPETEPVVPESEPELEPVVLEPEPVLAAAEATELDELGVEPQEPSLAAAGQEPAAPPRKLDDQRFLVNINRCTVEDLLGIDGVGRKLAQRIIDWRESHGGFRSIEDLRQVPGVGRKTYRALAGIESRSLNKLLGVADDRELTLQEIVKLTSQLKGIDGCMLAMSDGLFLTGQLPADFDQEAISVFAPQLFKKMGRYVKELRVGQVRRFTLFTDERPLSIFRAADVYLIVIHDTRHFSKRLLRQCERISQELARLCRQRTVV